ncbi:unnamed protein product [Enterobius vermicularis]|uniref:Amidohydro-rel domain-containing protein n=1 Tax=Enterobius vermicularis TaxID=51028 RepID=A0A0N4V9K0_ENTVE|nr:unnamed protein product [Enterobius vermicularis]
MKEIGLKAAIFGSDSAMVCVKALKMALSRLERATENNLHVLSAAAVCQQYSDFERQIQEKAVLDLVEKG